MSHMTTHSMPQNCSEKDTDTKEFKWCDIPLFTWKGWDIIDTDNLIFYDCEWYSKNVMDAMEQYYIGHPEIPRGARGMNTSVRLDGYIQIEVYGKFNKKECFTETYTIYEGWLPDITYVSMKMCERWKNMDAIM